MYKYILFNPFICMLNWENWAVFYSPNYLKAELICWKTGIVSLYYTDTKSSDSENPEKSDKIWNAYISVFFSIM